MTREARAAALARALAHDLRGMLHNLQMALELAGEQSADRAAGALPFLDLARAEISALDRLVEHLALLVRLQAGDTPWPTSPSGGCDLATISAAVFGLAPAPGRAAWPLSLPPVPVPVASAEGPATVALSALRDGLRLCTLRGDAVAVVLSPAGLLTLTGPRRWEPALTAAAALPDLPSREAAPARSAALVQLALAGLAARACGVRCPGPAIDAEVCRLDWQWPLTPGVGVQA